MQDDDWNTHFAKFLSFLISGEAGQYHMTPAGEPEPDDTFLVLLNAHETGQNCTLPQLAENQAWELLIDTTTQTGFVDGKRESGSAPFTAKAHSFLLWRRLDTGPS